MNSVLSTIFDRVFGRTPAAGDLAKLPAAYRNTGGGFMNRLALAGVLRLALRFPVLSIVVILSMIIARAKSRPHQAEPRPVR